MQETVESWINRAKSYLATALRCEEGSLAFEIVSGSRFAAVKVSIVEGGVVTREGFLSLELCDNEWRPSLSTGDFESDVARFIETMEDAIGCV